MRFLKLVFFVNQNLSLFGICIIVFFVLLPSVDGAAWFTKFPPNVLFISNGGTARFVWDYHVDNKATDFSDFSSPMWFYENLQSAIGGEVSSDGWNWKINTLTCPPRLLNPTRVSKESKATLVIKKVIAADNGTYGCSLMLKNLSSITSTSRLFITVPPQFISGEPPSTKSTNENQNLRIRCSATGYPTPNITWFQLGQSSKVELQQGVGSALLTISQILRSQSGKYVCEAINNKDEKPVSTETTVTVNYKPTIDVSLSTNNTESWNGNTVTLTCIADGLPPPDIKWYKNGGQLITSGVTLFINGSQLKITTKDSIDYGSYECEARNSVGVDKHLIKIAQLFPPGSPNITMSEDDIKAVSITVNWTKPVSDGGTPVLDYKVQVNSTNPPQEKNTSSNHVGFSGLKKNTKYEVKVFARNKVGYGEPSIKIITTKKQGAPSSPDIKLQSNNTAITLYWSKPDENGGGITKYTIYANGERIGVVTHNSDLKFVIDIKKLEPGTTYSFIVTATNEYGESVKDNSKAQRIRIPEITTPSILWTTTVINVKTPSGNLNKQQEKCSITGLAICLAVLVLSLILNLLQFLFIWRMKIRGRTGNEKTKRIMRQEPVGYPVYANALEMEENPAPCGTISETPQTTPPTVEYEPIRDPNIKPRSDSNDKPAIYQVNNTSMENPSHYQELTPQILGSVSKQNQPTYEPLHRQQSTGLNSQQPGNVSNTTYQPLGMKRSPSDYQSLHIYNNMKNRKKDGGNESIT